MDHIGSMNIAFFGASVTQQKTGYWKYFSEKDTSFKIFQFGYGSRHLNDAGICYIDEVLKIKPEYCFIDWFSTGYIKEENLEYIKIYIDTLIYKFLNSGVKPIFLIFPDETVNKENIYLKINDYISNLKIPVLDISKSFDDLNLILRDGIHTTDVGSKMYAELIYDYFVNKIHNLFVYPIYYPTKNKYCDIKKLNLNIVVTKKIEIKGNATIIGISQLIGPYTGLLKVNGVILNNWDKWCYYERDMVNISFKVNGITLIEILEDDFDRSSCDKNVDWSCKKILKLLDMFYIGNKIEEIKYI